MNHDDVIRLARQVADPDTTDPLCGGDQRDLITLNLDEMVRFAGLVAAKCGECGKSAAEGWALYCVQCSEDSMVKAAVAEEREAIISKIESEICHTEINNLRLAPLFGQRQGPLAVRVDSLAAVVDAIRARGEA